MATKRENIEFRESIATLAREQKLALRVRRLREALAVIGALRTGGGLSKQEYPEVVRRLTQEALDADTEAR